MQSTETIETHTEKKDEEKNGDFENAKEEYIKNLHIKNPPIKNILDKFQEILYENNGRAPYALEKSVIAWMNKIGNSGFKESEILKISDYIQSLKENDKINEAMQLTVVCAATESNLGNLILAREIFKGDIFKEDAQKAFRLTKAIALKNSPDALCDLGQYCEYGKGTKKSIEHALIFYKKAYDMGLDRAGILYERLKNKKGFFSFLFKTEI